MIRGIFVLRAISGVLFLIQLTLGILFWTGHALFLIPLHMAVGLLFVVSLLSLAVLTARVGAPRPPVIILATLAVVIGVVGFIQAQLLPGPDHWIVRVAHLALGILAMPIAGRLPTLLPSRARRPFCGDPMSRGRGGRSDRVAQRS